LGIRWGGGKKITKKREVVRNEKGESIRRSSRGKERGGGREEIRRTEERGRGENSHKKTEKIKRDIKTKAADDCSGMQSDPLSSVLHLLAQRGSPRIKEVAADQLKTRININWVSLDKQFTRGPLGTNPRRIVSNQTVLERMV